MGAYCAIDRFYHVLGVGLWRDDAIDDVPRREWSDVWRVLPCDDDIYACYCAGNDVIVHVVNGVAVFE